MKYESDILKRLIKTYGVVGNPRYISEIIKEFIVRGKERFPNLFTYQADWLAHIDEFGLTPDYVVSYTGQQIYAPHTKERPVKRAILSGNTLVNLVKNIDIEFRKTPTDSWGVLLGQSNRSAITKVTNIKPNTKYLIRILSKSKQVYVRFFNDSDNNSNGNSGWLNSNSTFTTLSDTSKINMSFRMSSNNEEYTDVSEICNIMLIEYQDGMENWDIPYFEGMQSVKLPVLTTTGKNLLNNNSLIKGKTIANTTVGLNINDLNTNPRRAVFSESVKLDIGEKYFLKSFNSDYQIFTPLHDENGIITQGSSWKNEYVRFIATSQYMRITVKRVDENEITDEDILKIKNNIMVCKSDDVEEYEPYKSNILTVNEDVELRGIGDVKDTLDCLTGEIVSNFSTYSFSDVDNWKTNTEANCQRFTLRISPSPIGSDYSDNVCIISDKLPGVKWNQSWNTVNTISCNGDSIAVQLPLGTTIEQFKELMRGSKIVYRIKSSIKTVDLSILDQNGENVKQLMTFNGGTHFNTTSLEGSPLPSLEVSVETDLEETLAVCSLEGNTM